MMTHQDSLARTLALLIAAEGNVKDVTMIAEKASEMVIKDAKISLRDLWIAAMSLDGDVLGKERPN